MPLCLPREPQGKRTFQELFGASRDSQGAPRRTRGRELLRTFGDGGDGDDGDGDDDDGGNNNDDDDGGGGDDDDNEWCFCGSNNESTKKYHY